ncbi:MAG: hypothetical protein RL095_4038 [Verrucomicrobiota bacterium]|jgi:glucose-6-phosphate 1-epimerase
MPLPEITLAHPSGSRARVSPYGAHVLSFVPAGGDEALFLSRGSQFQEGTAIRGGIPVIFPQFSSSGPLPRHGFARNRFWHAIPGLPGIDSEGRPQAAFELLPDQAIRALWPRSFLARLTLSLAADSLSVRLSVANSGEVPLEFTAALHTYLRLADASLARLHGLSSCSWRDHLGDATRRLSPDSAPLQPAMSIDRSYFDVPASLLLEDPAAARKFKISSAGFPDAVVWNPWVEGIRKLADMVEGEHLEMLCVEAAALSPVHLKPGEIWSGTQTIQVLSC